MSSSLNLFLLISSLVIAGNAMTIPELLLTGLRAFNDVYSTCREVQSKEIFFTGKCTLRQRDIQGNLDKLRAYILAQPNTMTMEQLFSNGFANSGDYFLANQANFTTEYRELEKRVAAIMTKVKASTKNAKLGEFKTAITESKMDVAYPIITNNSGLYCSQDSSTCTTITGLLNLTESTLAETTIDDFLVTAFENAFTYLSAPIQAEVDYTNDKTYVDALLKELRDKGTSGTLVQLLKPVFSNQLYSSIRYQFDMDYSTRSTKKIRTTTTKKPTKPPAVTVKKTTTLPFVSQAVYISVPLAFLCLGILLALAIVIFYYNLQPIVGGKKPATTPAASMGTYQKTEKF